MPGSLLGTAVVRVEDPELLEGRGTYVANLRVDGLLHLRFVRSTVAHARVTSIDTSDAAAMPGVVAVLTAADLPLPAHHGIIVLNPAGPRPPLATDTVYFVGDPVAVVVAETAAQAEDAAEAVIVDYEPLDSLIDMETALADDAPQLYEGVPGNLIAGQRSAADDSIFEGADVIVRVRVENQRIAVMPMEGNSIAVVPGADGQGHDLTIHVSTQMPHGLANMVAGVFELPVESLRVVTPHVGGGFGGKAGLIAEHSAVIGVARHLNRPVTWTENRSENLVAMAHGRGQVQYVEMGFTNDGTIVGMRVRSVGDAGAYAGFGGALLLGPSRMMAQGERVVAAVVGGAHQRGVREHVAAQEVLEPQLDRVDAELVGGDVHDPFEHRRRLGATGPAECTHRRGGRRRHRSLEADAGDAVHALRHHA